MNILTFKKTVSTCVMIAYTTLSTLIPMANVQAAPICDASNYTTSSGGTPGCAVKRFTNGPFAYAKFEWSQVGEVSQTPTSGIQLTMAKGDRILSSNNRTAAALGLNANQVADVMTLFPTNVPFVFARYNPMSKELRVDVFKVEKSGSNMKMMQAPFTPAHGGAFAAAGIYASPSDKASGFGPGANPFALFMKPGDDAFYNVDSLPAVQVAVGHAMRMAGSSIGLVAVASNRVNQWTETKKKWYKKTITTHIDGYTKPEWYVASPEQFQPQGAKAATCVINVATAADCPSYLMAPSGVAWSQWQGGNLPAFEDLTSNWQKSQSSFTLVAWVVVAFLVVVTAGAFAVAAGAGATALGPATFIQGMMATGAAGVGGGAALTMNAVLGAAAIEAAAVGVVSGLAGATLNSGVSAPYSGAKSGFGVPEVPSGDAARSLFDGVNKNFDNPSVTSMGVRAVGQGLYGVNCAPGAPASSCANSGVVPRPDLGTSTNNVQFWSDNGKPMMTASPLTE
jgi:hypothetical protein